MINDKQIDLLVKRLTNRINKQNKYFLTRIGESIKELRNLTPSQAQQLVQILKYGGKYEEIVEFIRNQTNLNIDDIDEIFSAFAKKDQMFYEKFYKYRDIPFVPFAENLALQRQTKALANIAMNEMYNLTRTNVLGYSMTGLDGKKRFYGLRETYNKVLDDAMINVGQGKETFDNAMSHILNELGGSGLRTIDYDSGRSVRLDSVAAMHLKGRLRELHEENQKIFGEEFGYDGIEISAHINSAPDHEMAQGRQFSKQEYERLNAGLDAKDYKGNYYTLDLNENGSYRPIHEMNCYHYPFMIVLGASKPEHTDQELKQMIEDNKKGFMYEGKHYTMYEGTQLQRMLERNIRKEKDIQTLAKASGNEYLVGETQNKISILRKKYKEVSVAAGLKEQPSRTKASGYKRDAQASKTYKQTIDKYKVGQFDITEYTDKFKPTTNDVLLTKDRYDHINGYENRKDAIDMIPEIIKNPGNVYIETSKKNTIWLTKKIDDNYSHKLVIKLNTDSLYKSKGLGYKHSVITMHPIKTERLAKYVNKRSIELTRKHKNDKIKM